MRLYKKTNTVKGFIAAFVTQFSATAMHGISRRRVDSVRLEAQESQAAILKHIIIFCSGSSSSSASFELVTAKVWFKPSTVNQCFVFIM